MRQPWWKNAVIYAVDVERFQDSDGDGLGDFPGLVARLPYLAELGITCLWLFPFYASIERDNGYDVDDYFQVRPQFGTLQDFAHFVQKAGELGIRVLIDLVVDHSSDRHPWFQAARRGPNSRYRDYYYWTEQPPAPEPGQATIFPGEEDSVWTYDELAGAYYHHRFYHFEPSLNVHNPLVREEIRRIVDFWMSFGIAGFRLDAAGHMIEHPGHASKPEDAHRTLRKLYGWMRDCRADSVLLGEVDMEPEDLLSFFAQRQMNMMFNFPLSNALALALVRGKADPILQVYARLPALPAQAQWGNFIRNFDEWDLERLTPKERREVFAAFAPKESMRLYGRGIRRRLAPMLEGDTARLRLAYSLLFALPGTPSLLYGDEIGMGEDLSQQGRYSVRAPMQWSGRRNAGFSTAAPLRLPQPAIARGRFRYEVVNVAAQSKDEDSLLSFMKRLIALRRALPCIGSGDFSMETSHGGRVLLQRYESGREELVVVHNLGSRPVRARIPCAADEYEELWTGTLLRAATDVLAARLEPHGFLWLKRKGTS